MIGVMIWGGVVWEIMSGSNDDSDDSTSCLQCARTDTLWSPS